MSDKPPQVIPPDVHDFPSLILWLRRHYHNDTEYQMAKRLRVSNALLHVWADGTTKAPGLRHVSRLCKEYDLPIEQVLGLISKKKVDVPPEVTDGRSLVVWLSREYHDGTYRGIAKRVGVSSPLVYQWKDGVAHPGLRSLEKICEAYDLDAGLIPRMAKRR